VQHEYDVFRREDCEKIKDLEAEMSNRAQENNFLQT